MPVERLLDEIGVLQFSQDGADDEGEEAEEPDAGQSVELKTIQRSRQAVTTAKTVTIAGRRHGHCTQAACSRGPQKQPEH